MSSTPELLTSDEPSVGEMLDETLPLVGAVPLYGPPVIVLAAPWLLLSLMLAGPFALVLTFAVVLAAAAVVVVLVGALLASPYLLVRHLLRRHARRASATAPAPQIVVLESAGVAA